MLFNYSTFGIEHEILENNTLEKKLTVRAHKFSDKAKEEIEKLGGKAEVI